jgi:mono/diheme cytochrome c family protein
VVQRKDSHVEESMGEHERTQCRPATRRLAPLCFLAALALGCYLGSGQKSDVSGPAGDRAVGDATAPAGLPCPVAELLARHCMACHGASGSSSGTSLASLADLKRASKLDPTRTEAALALARMKDGSMPPQGTPAPDAASIAAFESWVGQGLPAGSCGTAGGDAGPDPFAGPHVCTSNSYYTIGQGLTMEPGNACISCHTTRGEGEGPAFTIAGTAYPTGHEPSRCYATGVAGARVVVVDATGANRTYSVNSVGNFAGLDAIATPYTARVELAGRTRAMATPQTTGDCNSCHTEHGAIGAPGRVVVP